jgi:hypothetical protein
MSYNQRVNRFRPTARRLVCLVVGLVMAMTTAVALARQSDELRRTPQSVIDEAFAVLPAKRPVITPPSAPQINACQGFDATFLDPACSRPRKKRTARGHGHRVATYIAGRLDPSTETAESQSSQSLLR